MSKQRRDPVCEQLGYLGYVRVRDSLLREQGRDCFWCQEAVYRDWRDAPDVATWRERKATIDHIEAISRGGTWKRYNLCISCHHCNTRKGSMDEEEFHALIMDEMEAAA